MYNLGPMLDVAGNRETLQEQIAGNAPATFLSSIKLKIISNCNLRCEMCRYWQMAKQRLEPETVFSVLDHASSLGCQKVHFSGGEVTLHGDLNRFIAHGASLGMRINLTSNGVTMNKQRAKDWVAAGLRSASFSLDGVNSRTHDKIRGVQGAFKRTCHAVQILHREATRKRSKLRIRINTVLSQQNFKQLPALTELAGKLGAVDVVPMPIDGKKVVRPTIDEIRYFNERIAPQTIEIRERYGMPLNSARIFPFGRSDRDIAYASIGQYGFGYYDSHTCYAPWLHAFISHDGHVYACCMTRQRMQSLGNVKQQTLTEIFHGTAYQSFRQQMRIGRLEVCKNCDQYLPENQLVDERLRQPRVFMLSARPSSVAQTVR